MVNSAIIEEPQVQSCNFLPQHSPSKALEKLVAKPETSKDLYVFVRKTAYATADRINEIREVRRRVQEQCRQALAEKGLIKSFQSIVNAKVPERWIEEGSSQPSTPCRAKSFRLTEDIYTNYRLLPTRIDASRLGGIMLLYKLENAVELEVEIDNELDVVGVVATQESVLASSEIREPYEWRQFIQKARTTASLRATIVRRA